MNQEYILGQKMQDSKFTHAINAIRIKKSQDYVYEKKGQYKSPWLK